MEEQIQLTTSDNHLIYGTLNYQQESKKTLLIFVHGLTGSQNEHLCFNAVPFFTSRNFDTFRFDLYSSRKQGRKLSECDISTHSADLNMVLDNFKDKYQNIILIGHSLGVPTILQSNYNNIDQVTKIVLWDPTRGLLDLNSRSIVYYPQLKKYIWHKSKEVLLSESMVKEWKAVSDIKSQIEKITKPCKFIFAGDHYCYDAWKPFLPEISVASKVSIIPNATHVFYEEGTEKILFEETLSWIQ